MRGIGDIIAGSWPFLDPAHRIIGPARVWLLRIPSPRRQLCRPLMMIGCRFTPAFVSFFWYYPRHAQSSFLTRREAGYRIAPILHRRTLQCCPLRARPHRRHHGRHHRHPAGHGAGHRQRRATPARPLHRHHRRYRDRRDRGLSLLHLGAHRCFRGDPLPGGPAVRGGGGS